MTTPAQRSARLELDTARPAVARLDLSRGVEDLAADIVETWGAVEAALRMLVGSTVLSGQPLIREARQRQLINFDQANSLAEFQATRDRVQDTSYQPTEADLNAARGAFLKLDTALLNDLSVPSVTGPISQRVTGGTATAPLDAATPPEAGPVKVVAPPRRFPVWVLATAGSIALAVILLIVIRFAFHRESALEQGVDAYRKGQREVAVSDFNRAVREDKNAVLPHVYLARMAREVGNFTLANQELQLALEIDPNDGTALREMANNLFAQNNYELARRFYVRAIQADPTDKTSQGYLGCVLMRLNRVQEGTSFLNRAGPGPWSNCTAPAPNAQTPAGTSGPKSVPR
jgi:tetratricopeptide (TPR) repeat protein